MSGERGYYLHNNDEVRKGSSCPGEGLYCNPRPLVVIDPEDPEQVERLTSLVVRAQGGLLGPVAADMQAALRSLVTPPKPPEPLGFLAEVEDCDGQHWLRVYQFGSYPWVRRLLNEANGTHLDVLDCGAYNTHTYADIAAVRVLSEGIAS